MDFIQKMNYYGVTGKERARKRKEHQQLQIFIWTYYQLAYGMISNAR